MAEVRDGGPWRGPTEFDWLNRFKVPTEHEKHAARGETWWFVCPQCDDEVEITESSEQRLLDGNR